jgi:putative ABC transport system permease protein
MQAQAEMESITRALREKYPEANALRGAKVTSLRSLLTDGAKPLLLLLLGIVGAVLLIACANVANLLLARSTVRQREVAIRAVLGAGRWQVMRSLLMESILLAVMGGALGLLISLWGVDLLTALMPVDVPRITGLQPDWRVLLFTLAASVLTGVLCGIAPAWSASNINLTEAMKEGGRHSTSGRSQNLFRDVLVVGQIAIALTLLTGAGLLLRSFIHLQQVNPGFDSRNLLTATVVLSSDRYEKPEHILNFFRELQSRLRTLPGVTAVTLAQSIPLTSRDNGTRMEIEGKPFPKGQQPDARLRFISPDYFRTIGIQQLAGRDFSQRDTQDAPPVVIINEAFVQQYFPGESPLGKKLILGWGGDEPKEIVGVFSNVRHRGLDDQPRPEMYVPHAQFPVPDMTLMLRTSVKPESLTPALTAKVRELDAQLPVTDVRTLDEYRHDSVALPRFSTFVLLTFASLALLLSVIGLYGVISYSVTRRVSEFGVRMALGAQPRDILTMVLRQGMKRVIIGVALGVAASMGLSRLLTKLLYGISPNDPITIIGVVALLLLTAFAACLLPARRATKVDPITALRCE